jgi:hypothetical protein
MAAAQAPGVPILDFTFNYGAAASSSGPGPQGTFQYCAVKATANDIECAPSSSAGVTISANSGCLGVLQTQGVLNNGVTVRMLGLSKLVVDGSGTAINPGNWLTNDAAGRGVVDTASSSAAAFAMALQKSTAQNDIITVFVLPSQVY